MKRVSLFLAVVLGVLGLLTTASAQQRPTFSRPAVSLRLGAVQTVNESTGGLAPYVEIQSRVHLGNTPFGVALYGGISREQSKEVSVVLPPDYCFPRCPDTDTNAKSRKRHLDLATGLRFGIFPRHGPVEAFVGLASHFVHRTEANELFEDREEWERATTLEGGVNVQVPVTHRLDITGGVRGFLPVRVGEGALHIGEWEPSDSGGSWEVDMSRVGFQVGVQYGL